MENNKNETNWKDQDLQDVINRLLQSKSRWHLIVAPAIYLIFLCFLLLSDMETINLIIKQSYSHRLLWFAVISFLLVLPAEYLFNKLAKFIGWLKKKYTGKEDPIFRNIWVNKFLFIWAYVVIAHMNFESVESDINASYTSPRQTVNTVVSDIIVEKRGKHDRRYIEFEIEGEKHRHLLSDYKREEYKVGDAISVSYRKGCLNWMIFEDIHHIIEYRNPY